MSTVNLLHYREWQGRLRGPLWSVWPVARVALGSLLRRKLFWLLYAVSLILFLMFFFGSLLLSWVETRLTGPIQFGSVHWEPDRIMQWIRRVMSLLEGNQYTFAYFFVYQGNAVMVALTLT